jgi:cysteinyl-tRNA synthetase, unknown class
MRSLDTNLKAMKNRILFFAFVLILSACKRDKAPEGIDFRAEMRTLVEEISTTARSQDADFIVIPQNGAELLSTTTEANGPLATGYVAAISGISREDLNFGYNKDDEATPATENAYMRGYLDKALAAGLPVLVTDYCSTPSNMDASYTANAVQGYVGFAADRRDLDHIPSYPSPIDHENAGNIQRLDQVLNYLYLINPSQFASRQAYIDAVRATNYDLLLMDLYFNDGSSFTAAEVESMRDKANGGRRLVICYMSIGEAEDYRPYWNKDWKFKNPEWLRKENKQWAGNYKVWYWDAAWKQIIFGQPDSYLTHILDAGYDGVFLDIIDGFEYFENL